MSVQLLQGQRGRESHKYSYFSSEDHDRKERSDLLSQYVMEYEKNKGYEYECEHWTADSRVESRGKYEIGQISCLKEENERLKHELAGSKEEVEQLKKQLDCCRNQLKITEDKIESTNQEKKLKEHWFMDEICMIAEKKRQIDQQIAYMRLMLTHEQNRLCEFYSSFNQRRASSSKVDNIQKEPKLKEKDKSQLFIDSIKQMHFSIVGHKQANLHQLWRWLKSLAHIYALHRQWKNRTSILITSKHPPFQSLLYALKQGLTL